VLQSRPALVGISKDIVALLTVFHFAPDQPIKVLILPNASSASIKSLKPVRGERFPRVQKLSELPIVTWFNHDMDVVVHDDIAMQGVAMAIKPPESGGDGGATVPDFQGLWPVPAPLKE
jgi:hypothetical protein